MSAAAAATPAFSLADLAKDCIDSLRRATAAPAAEQPDELAAERCRIDRLTPKTDGAPCPPIVRHGGDEARCRCAWCDRDRPIGAVQHVPFLAGRFVLSCAECVADVAEFVANPPPTNSAAPG